MTNSLGMHVFKAFYDLSEDISCICLIVASMCRKSIEEITAFKVAILL